MQLNRILLIISMMMVLHCVSGCNHRFSRSSGTESQASHFSPLVTPRLSSDAVTLEIAVVTLDESHVEAFDEVWRFADLQSISFETRRNLDRNGLRVGILGQQLPGVLTEVLSWSPPLVDEGEFTPGKRDDDLIDDLNLDLGNIDDLLMEGSPLEESPLEVSALIGADPLEKSRWNPLLPRMDRNKMPLVQNEHAHTYCLKEFEQLQSGVEHWVPSNHPSQQMRWTVDTDDSRRSGNCLLAQCGFVLQQVATGDGSIRLTVTPAIHHGQRRHRYGVDQETLLVREEQQTLKIHELQFERVLRIGQTIIISSTEPPVGLGQSFLSLEHRPDARQVVLIRLVQTGHDDLFAPGLTKRRLSTRLD